MQHIFALENEVFGCVMAALKAACASIVLVLHPISLSRLGICHACAMTIHMGLYGKLQGQVCMTLVMPVAVSYCQAYI